MYVLEKPNFHFMIITISKIRFATFCSLLSFMNQIFDDDSAITRFIDK